MDLSDFQRKAVLLIFISILLGSILLARKEPLKEKKVIELTEQSSAPLVQKAAISAKIDINTADLSAIMQLPGIGTGLAKQIIDNRPFETMEDLLKVPGIGEKRLARIKEFIDLPESSQSSDIPPRIRAIAQSTVSDMNIIKIDLNKTTAEQLSNIPSIGPIIAQAIIDYREKSGGFKNLEELMNVPRIGKKTYEKIKGYLCIQPQMAEQMAKTQSADAKSAGKDAPQPLYDSRTDPEVKCPYCGKQLWEEGQRKQKYILCPHCLKSLNEPSTF